MKQFGEKEAWAYLGTEEIFRVPRPLLSQERKKLRRISNLAGIFISERPSEQKKIPLKILEKRERGRVQGLLIVFGYPLLSQGRVKLRISNFACTLIDSIGTKAH